MSVNEIEQLLAGDMSVLQGHTFTEAQIEAIRDYKSELLSLSEELQEVREEVQEAFTYGTGDSVRHSETLMEKTIYEASLLEDGTVVRISINQQTIGLLLLKMTQPIAIIIVISMITSGLMAQYMARKITEPINNLDLDKPLENDVYDEMSPLIRRIHSQQKQIINPPFI